MPTVTGWSRNSLSSAGHRLRFYICDCHNGNRLSAEPDQSGFFPCVSRQIAHRRNPNWLYPFGAVLCVLAVVQLVVGWVKAVYLLKINGKFAIVGNSLFMWHILHPPTDFFSQHMAGIFLPADKTTATNMKFERAATTFRAVNVRDWRSHVCWRRIPPSSSWIKV